MSDRAKGDGRGSPSQGGATAAEMAVHVAIVIVLQVFFLPSQLVFLSFLSLISLSLAYFCPSSPSPSTRGAHGRLIRPDLRRCGLASPLSPSRTPCPPLCSLFVVHIRSIDGPWWCPGHDGGGGAALCGRWGGDRRCAGDGEEAVAVVGLDFTACDEAAVRRRGGGSVGAASATAGSTPSSTAAPVKGKCKTASA